MPQLNPALVEQQELTREDIAKINKLHKKKNKLFTLIEYWLKKGNLQRIRESAQMIEEIEYKMQEAWKFDRTSDMHTHWLDNPACSCPKMDNRERFYTGQRIYIEKCLVHGHIVFGDKVKQES